MSDDPTRLEHEGMDYGLFFPRDGSDPIPTDLDEVKKMHRDLAEKRRRGFKPPPAIRFIIRPAPVKEGYLLSLPDYHDAPEIPFSVEA